MAEQNSIQTFLPEYLRMFNNSMESFEKVNQAITSSRESVTVNIQNDDGTISQVTIPSFGFLKNSIDRLDRNIQTITNLNGAESSIRLADGTFRKLVLAKLPVEAPDLTSLNSINTFGTQSNWFFEGLINPLLIVTFDLSGQVPINTERAIVRRYILNANTQSKKNLFNNSFNSRSDLNYDEFIQQLIDNNMSYVLDEAVVDLPPRDKKFSGKFSVIRIDNVDVTQEINGVTTITTKKLYKLNKRSYTDIEANFPDTQGLVVGDFLEVVSNPIDTRYQVLQVDTSTNSIVLELIEGVRAISIGADVLKIASSINDNVELEVSIGFDERSVVFIKPIDPGSKIPAVNWSPGSGFYTSDLIIIDQNGSEQTLATFYQQQAVDFGRFLLSFAQDKIPTSKQGVKPNAPELEEQNFKVVLINGQVTNSDAIVQLQELNNSKNTLESELKEYDTAISQIRIRIQTTNYATQVERQADKNELQGIITTRTSQAELYSSIVKEIAARGQDNSVASVLPKYRARGFWSMPEQKSTPDTGIQDIIKFVTRYRYLSPDGAANPIDEFNFKDGIGTSAGAFSNWVQLESTIRPREKNTTTGLYEWIPIDDENAEAININQLDVPVRKGEIVEVQVKSICEAGWPGNPLMSDWSEAIRIDFPADLSSNSVVETILSENKEDLARISLEEDLNEMGIQEHLSSSFTANEQYFAHTSTAIASGFLSESQTPITLFTKLVNMQNQLIEFEEILRILSGELVVTLVDELGNATPLARNTLTKIFAGFYQNEVQDLDDPRGAVVSKTFYINLDNSEQTTLQLISRVSGNRLRMTKESENPTAVTNDIQSGKVIIPAIYDWLDNFPNQQNDLDATFQPSDSDYNTMRRYDLTPLVLTNPTVEVSNPFGQDISMPPYQSAQNKGQFIFSRFKDVSSEDVFYSYRNPDGEYVINLDTAENFYGDNGGSTITSGEFIWGGTFLNTGLPSTLSSSTWDSNVLGVHVEHPMVATYGAFKESYEDETGDTTTLPSTVPGAGYDASVTGGGAQAMFRQSKFAPIKTGRNRLGKKQNIYINEDILALTTQLAGDIYPSTSGNPWPSTINTPTGLQNLEPSPSLNYTGLITLPSGDSYSRNAKASFAPLDQYMIGQPSCGSYLFLATEQHENIQVNGDATLSTKAIAFGSNKSLNVPLIFQYRMTDYFGQGSGSTGGGRGSIGGDSTGATVNLAYSKRIGFDIYKTVNDVYQFDVEVFATYRSLKLNLELFPSATIQKSLIDLEKVVARLSPSITETKVNKRTETFEEDKEFFD